VYTCLAAYHLQGASRVTSNVELAGQSLMASVTYSPSTHTPVSRWLLHGSAKNRS